MIFLLPFLAVNTWAAAPVFGQDPLCAEPPKVFAEKLDKARVLHLKYPQLHEVSEAENKWFAVVAGEMKSICDDDVKFALELVKKDRSELSGQCKPAAEAALADQEVLEHSEGSLKRLRGKTEAYLLKGSKGGPETLWEIFKRDYKRVSVDSLDEMEIPRESACELRWAYPKAFLDTQVPFVGCPEAPPGVKLSDSDRKDAGIFAQMMTRYVQSVDYNTQRRNNALATATASKARYEACIAQNPGTENVLVKAAGTGGSSAPRVVPQGAHVTKGSDITGVKEDQDKQK